MTIAIWVIGTVLVQAVITVLLARFIRAGKLKHALEAGRGASQQPRSGPGIGPARPAIGNYADLAALLEALSPQLEGVAPKQEEPSPAIVEKPVPLPWPGSLKQ